MGMVLSHFHLLGLEMAAFVLRCVQGVLVADHPGPVLAALALTAVVAGMRVKFPIPFFIPACLPFLLVNLPVLIVPFRFGIFFEQAVTADRFSHLFVMLQTFRADIETFLKGAVAGPAHYPAHGGLEIQVELSAFVRPAEWVIDCEVDGVGLPLGIDGDIALFLFAVLALLSLSVNPDEL